MSSRNSNLKPEGLMDFCSKVAVKLLVEGLHENKNILTSPLSYNAIMNMIAAGSSGETLDQILQTLQHNNVEEVNSNSSKFAEITSQQPEKTRKRKIDGEEINSNEGPILSFLNGVWVNQNYRLKDSFQELMENLYKANVTSIDCGKPELAVKEINEWASASTKGLIEQVLRVDHIAPNTTIILGNALYFKGSWEKAFKKQYTHPMSFYLLNGEEIKSPFMTGCEKYSVQSFPGFQVARIPYSDGGEVNRKFAMYILLPNEKDGLNSLLRNVDSNPKFFEQYCDKKGRGVDVFWIPKFKFNYLTEKSPKMMKGMGLTLPFDIEEGELSEMIHGEKAYVSNIIQKAFIEVNEEGTEAAAVTFGGVWFGCSAAPRPPPTKFIADHPFMFIIREENSGILFFAGTVINPLQA